MEVAVEYEHFNKIKLQPEQLTSDEINTEILMELTPQDLYTCNTHALCDTELICNKDNILCIDIETTTTARNKISFSKLTTKLQVFEKKFLLIGAVGYEESINNLSF